MFQKMFQMSQQQQKIIYFLYNSKIRISKNVFIVFDIKENAVLNKKNKRKNK